MPPSSPGPRPALARELPERPLAVATTTVVADLARQVAQEAWEVRALIPLGADPHAFAPTPSEAGRVARARVVLMVGAGLEPPGLVRLIRSAASPGAVVELAPRGAARDAAGGPPDPHGWTRVAGAIEMVGAIAQALGAADPARAAAYEHRAGRYVEELRALDAWIRTRVARIPPERRLLVTNHETLSAFAAEYGFEIVGAVLPSSSTLAQPSAARMARLVEDLRRLGVPAVFTETTAAPALAGRLADEAGVELVTLYTDSLGPPGSGADTYVGYMRTNVSRIVEALSRGG